MIIMNLENPTTILIILSMAILYYVWQLNQKLKVCPKTGEIPCKCPK